MLEGRVGIITGGGLGIGRGIARQFAHAGAAVVIAEIDADAGHEAEEAISKDGGRASLHLTDVTDPRQVADLAAFAKRTYGTVDILVNNAAALYARCDALDLEFSEWRRLFEINLEGAFLCSQAVAPHMIERGVGRIVNISSAMYLLGEPQKTAYQTTKGALNGLTRSLAVELAPHNILVNAIAPGMIETRRTIDLLGQQAFKAAYFDTGRIPSRRVGHPDDIASVALFLASPENSYMTGQVVIVDGGMSLTL